jgi:D-cysteine desulfhydrase family pyridoxal phosphate-dependent enzyme
LARTLARPLASGSPGGYSGDAIHPELSAVISPDDLASRLDALPRIPLAFLPTPLEPAPRLSAALGGPDIVVKRDDMTGLALGGNKTRQLERVFADLRERGSDVLVAGAYTQSNWCRQMTAAACKLGLDVSLVLVHGVKGPALQGNLLLDRLMGAEVEVVELDTLEKLQPLLDAKAEALRAAGRRPYIVGPFHQETLTLGTVGYVEAALELAGQLDARGLDPDALYVSGANMTPAGLQLGLKALGRRTRVVCISPISWQEDRPTDIARLANRAAALLGIETRLEAGEVEASEAYIGPGYGIVTGGCREALRLAAATEGLILDPVYTGKALAGLIDHVRQGRWRAGRQLVFVHTGGVPALFAYADDLGL